MKTVRILIKGKVQGVFYRATAKDVANEVGLTGWVKNTEDGDVEVVVSGADDRVSKFLSWCWKGPKRAAVTDVIITEKELQLFKKFTVIR